MVLILRLLIGVIVGSLLLASCSDQPSESRVLPTSTVTREALPLPSTPEPVTNTALPIYPVRDTPSPLDEYTVIPVTLEPGATPTVQSQRTQAPPPKLSGSVPAASLDWGANLPNAAKSVARLSGQAKTQEGEPEPLRALATSPDKKFLALADRSEIWIVELSTGTLLQKLAASASLEEAQGANSLAWSPDGKLFAAGGLSGLITLWRWDAQEGKFRKGALRLAPMQTTFAEAFGDAVEVAFSADGKFIAGFGSDGTIRFYDASTTLLRYSFNSSYAGYMAWSPDNKRLVDEFLILHYLETKKSYGPNQKVSSISDTPQGVAWSPDGKLIAISGDAFEMLLISAPLGDKTTNRSATNVFAQAGLRDKVTMPHLKEGRRVVWSPDSQMIAIANVPVAGQISLWDTQAQLLLTIEGSSEQVIRSLIWPKADLLLSAGNDGIAQIWQLTNTSPEPEPTP